MGTLQEALEWALFNASGLIAELRLPGGIHNLSRVHPPTAGRRLQAGSSSTVRLNAFTAASNIRLIGDGSTTILSSSEDVLFEIQGGAPPVYFEGIIFHGSSLQKSAFWLHNVSQFNASSCVRCRDDENPCEPCTLEGKLTFVAMLHAFAGLYQLHWPCVGH